jgi:hypothetical protein
MKKRGNKTKSLYNYRKRGKRRDKLKEEIEALRNGTFVTAWENKTKTGAIVRAVS